MLEEKSNIRNSSDKYVNSKIIQFSKQGAEMSQSKSQFKKSVPP